MFSWDTAKATANLEKHRICFEEAATVFSDADGLDWQDLEHSSREPDTSGLGSPLAEEF